MRRKSRSKRAGLKFPVGRIRRYLRNSRYKNRIGETASVCFAGILEYLAAEILDISAKAAKDNMRSRSLLSNLFVIILWFAPIIITFSIRFSKLFYRITPRYLQLAIRNDPDFKRLLHDVTIRQGGVLPNIRKELLPKKVQRSTRDTISSRSSDTTMDSTDINPSSMSSKSDSSRFY